MKTKILCILTGFILLPFVLLVGGRIPYFLLYVYLLSLIIPLIHCLMGKLFLRGEITIPEKDMSIGEEIDIKYVIKNNSFIGFPKLEIENSIARMLTGNREKLKLVSLESKSSLQQVTTVVCRRRGIYAIGDINIRIGDIFNLYSIDKGIKSPIHLKVYPKIIPLTKITIDRSKDYFALSDLRDYQEGDPLKKVHWKASAKRETLMVKNYEAWGEEEVVIILDSSLNSYHGDYDRKIEDKAVETTLSIVNYFLINNTKVTLYYQKNNKALSLTGDNDGFLKLYMEELVDFHPNGIDAFYQYVGDHSSKIKSEDMLFIITPKLDKKLGVEGIRLKLKSKLRLVILGDSHNNSIVWRENKKIRNILEQEGITNIFIDEAQDIRKVMEERYLHGA